MELNHNSSNLMEVVEKTEEEVARLYQIYSETFPKYKDLWSGLVIEQINHINTIHGLIHKIKSGSLQCREDKVDCKAIEELQAKVKQEIIRAKQRKITPIESLAIALEIEKTISKREYSEALDENQEEVRIAFSYLTSNTQKRINWIEEHLKKAELTHHCTNMGKN